MIFNFASQTPLWVSLLPFAGSVLLFVAAMVTLAFTIRSTNKRAKEDRVAAQVLAVADRDAAREKDRIAWRRDTLLRLATEAMSATVTATEQYRRVRDSPEKADVSRLLDRITAAGEVILSASTTLSILGATESASECQYLYGAVTDKELKKLLGEKPTWDQGAWERFAELLGQIDHRAGVFAQIIAKEIGEPKQKVPAIPFRTENPSALTEVTATSALR